MNRLYASHSDRKCLAGLVCQLVEVRNDLAARNFFENGEMFIPKCKVNPAAFTIRSHENGISKWKLTSAVSLMIFRLPVRRD